MFLLSVYKQLVPIKQVEIKKSFSRYIQFNCSNFFKA